MSEKLPTSQERPPKKRRTNSTHHQQRHAEEQQIFNSTTTTTTLTTTTLTLIPHISEIANQTTTYFHDCSISTSEVNNSQQQQSVQTTYEWIKYKLKSKKRKNIQLKGKVRRIAGIGYYAEYYNGGFDNSSMQDAKFDLICFLKCKQSNNKLYIADMRNHIIRSISNISINNDKWNGELLNNDGWNGELKIEVGQPQQQGYSNGDRSTCKFRDPSGFDWDMNDNMYICNKTCICKVDSKSNQVSLVAGHGTENGYKDGNNDEARFDCLKGILCYQQNCQSPLVLYACENWANDCIRMIDVTNGKTTTFAGKGEEKGDVDGTLQSSRFFCPWDIVKDDEDDDILYVSDSWNHKIKMIDMKKGMVSTLVGDGKDRTILSYPHQMQIIDPIIYVVCFEFLDCIVKIDKHSKQVTKIRLVDGNKVSIHLWGEGVWGIAYHELDQCFYISDDSIIYKLE